MMEASLNRCRSMEDQAGDFLKQLAAKLQLVLLVHHEGATAPLQSHLQRLCFRKSGKPSARIRVPAYFCLYLSQVLLPR